MKRYNKESVKQYNNESAKLYRKKIKKICNYYENIAVDLYGESILELIKEYSKYNIKSPQFVFTFNRKEKNRLRTRLCRERQKKYYKMLKKLTDSSFFDIDLEYILFSMSI